MSWCSEWFEVSLEIMKLVQAEGGYLVHENGKSFFERKDKVSGELVRTFSKDVMIAIKTNLECLHEYAKLRRSQIDNGPSYDEILRNESIHDSLYAPRG